ncbi:MAG: hypothetical protein ACJ8FY_22860 [Gemmataceae bacterium]
MTRKTQMGWLAAGAALGFASVMLGPKILDRMHSTASADTKPEKSASMFDQVAQVWPKPKGGNEEQEQSHSTANPKASGKKEDSKREDSSTPESESSAPDPIAPQNIRTVDTAARDSSETLSKGNTDKDIQALATDSQAFADSLPPQENAKADQQAKPPIRLRGNVQEAVEPPPEPPVSKDAKSQDPEPSKAPGIQPQTELASPPPLPEKRVAPQPESSQKAPAPDVPPSSLVPARESRPPALEEVALPAPRQTSVDLPPTTQAVPSVAVTIRTVAPTKKTPAVAKAKPLPLTGMHPCNLDDKKGLVLPESLVEQLGESDVVFLTPGADQSLWLTTAGGLEKLTDKLEKKTDGEEDGKVSRRHYFALTQRAAVEKAGRLVIPAALAAGADLKREIVLIGVGDHVEIWDAQRWQKYCQAAETDSATSEGR